MNKAKVGASWIYACFFTIAIALLASCTTHLVAPYDQSNQTALATISSDIMGFYEGLLETPLTQRNYASSEKMYGQIESEIRVFLIKQPLIPVNKPSLDASKDLLDRWEKARSDHRKNNTYSDADLTIDRANFQGILSAIFQGETAKQMAASPTEK